MDNERKIETAADRIVQWAAFHPLSAAETETRYAHLLKGLPALAERDLRLGEGGGARWSVFDLGRLAVRYWRDRVEDFAESLGAGAFVSPAAARGETGPVQPRPERTLKADGRSGTACVKLIAGADSATLDLVLWLEPKTGDADLPFTVTVLDSAKQRIGGPTVCAARNLIRFQAIAPAEEYTLAFETAAERWEIRWGFAADE